MIDTTKQMNDIMNLLNDFAFRCARLEFKGLMMVGIRWDDSTVYARDLYLVNQLVAIGALEVMKQYVINNALQE